MLTLQWLMGGELFDWQLMAIINGWTPAPSQVPAAEWLVAALRVSAG